MIHTFILFCSPTWFYLLFYFNEKHFIHTEATFEKYHTNKISNCYKQVLNYFKVIISQKQYQSCSTLTCFLDALLALFSASCSSFLLSSMPSCSPEVEGCLSSAAGFTPSSASSIWTLVLSLLLSITEVDWSEPDVEVQGSGSTLVRFCLFLAACCLSTVHSSLM